MLIKTFLPVRKHLPLYWTKIICNLSVLYKFTCNFSIWALINSKLSARQDGSP